MIGALPEAEAQVVITTGVQEIYDDNIFLENDKRRPTPVVADDAIDDDIGDNGRLDVFTSEQADGQTDEDLITNVFVAVAGEVPVLQKYAETSFENRVGALIFADFEDQNRLTLDATLESNLTDGFLPNPYYVGVRADINSESSDAGVAAGTSARMSQTLTTSLRTGVENVELSERTTAGLGYTGTYHAFLGAWRFKDSEERFEEEGSDYHSHIGSGEIKYKLRQNLNVGVNGSAGTQLYTHVDTTQGSDLDKDDLDRNIADTNLFVQYFATDALVFSASAGIGFSELHNKPDPVQRTVINDDGKSQTVLFEREEDQTSFVFSGNMFYGFEPGSSFDAGVLQELSNDIDGEPITTRSVFANLTKALGDRLSFTLAGTFVQFSAEDNVTDSTDRWEASTSLNYQLTQTIALVAGYNYVNQDSSGDSLEDQLRFLSQDYESNRVFVGINGGFIGLPL